MAATTHGTNTTHLHRPASAPPAPTNARHAEITRISKPVDPLSGGQLYLLDGPPRLAWFDQLGLVEAVDGFGQRVVIGAADGTHRGLDARFGQAFGEPDRGVLRSPICMVDNSFQIEYTFLLAGPDGLFDRVEHHGGCHGRCHSPAQDPPGVGVDDEGDVGKSRPGRHVGQIGDPQPVRCRRPELSPHEISWPGRSRVGDRGVPWLAPDRAGQAQLAHQPLHRAAGHLDALAVERQPHFARPVDAVVGGMNPLDMALETAIADLTCAGLTVDLLVVGRRGDLNTELNQPGADRLDTPPQTITADAPALMIGDEPTD